MNLAASLRRTLRRPGFGLTVAALLAAVVAVNAIAFSALWALERKALPWADSDELVQLRTNLVNFGFMVGLSDSLAQTLRTQDDTFAGLVAWAGNIPGRRDEQGRTWRERRISHDFAQVLGVAPALGRSLSAADIDGDGRVLVLADGTWRDRFGADPAIVGQTVRLGGEVYTIVGVMPPGFVFPDRRTEAWMPYIPSAAEREQDAQGNVGGIDVVARLADGASPDQALARVDALLNTVDHLAGLRASAGLRADVRPWRENFAAEHRQGLVLLQLAAIGLLLVVGFNLANLCLDRLLARQREFAICHALGARGRDRLSAVLGDLLPAALAGTVLGLALVPAGIALLDSRGLLPTQLPVRAGLDLATFLAGLACAAAVISLAVLVALAAGRRPKAAAGLGERSRIAGLGRARSVLLLGQVALTTALLGGGVLLLRSAINLAAEERGFDERGVLLAAVDLAGVTQGGEFDPGRDSERLGAQLDTLREDLGGLPGVTAVAAANMTPFSGWEAVSSLTLPGSEGELQARLRMVGPGYFEALGIPLVAGRGFADGDDAAQPVIVDEVFVRRWLDGREPLGAQVQLSQGEGEPPLLSQIVGVAATVKHEALHEPDPLPTLYRFGPAPLPVAMLVLRTDGDPASLVAPVRERIAALAPDAKIVVNRPLAELVAQSLAGRRALVELVAVFAAITLALAAVGLYAVLGFAVRRRTGELGVRMALGARPARIRRMVLGQGAALALGGAAIGLLVGIPLARLLTDRLHQVSSSDPLSWALAVIAVASAAIAACALPAWRAARVPPRVALESAQ
jgi:putative ABC transport system permease protein